MYGGETVVTLTRGLQIRNSPLPHGLWHSRSKPIGGTDRSILVVDDLPQSQVVSESRRIETAPSRPNPACYRIDRYRRCHVPLSVNGLGGEVVILAFGSTFFGATFNRGFVMLAVAAKACDRGAPA